jgi:hypothetical protein
VSDCVKQERERERIREKGRNTDILCVCVQMRVFVKRVCEKEKEVVY